MKYPLYVFKRVNGQEYYCGVGDVWLENMLDKKKNFAADTKKASKFSISHQKQKCEYCGRPLEAPIELESGKCLNCLDVLS